MAIDARSDVTRTFECAVLINDETGRSRFVDRDHPMTTTDFAPPAAPLDFASLGTTTSVAVIGSDGAWRGNAFHPSPARQLMVVLQGRGTITASDGETRAFGPGDAVLLEDTVGQGHSSRFFGETKVLVVRLGPA